MDDRSLEILTKLYDDGAELIFVFNEIQFKMFRLFEKINILKVQGFLELTNPEDGKLISVMLVIDGSEPMINLADFISNIFSGIKCNANKKILQKYYPNIWATLV